jgi:hypothetical protein
MDTDILSGVWNVIVPVRSELLLFVAAMVAYFALFMQRSPKNPKLQAKKMKILEEECKEEDYPSETCTKNNTTEPKGYANVEQTLQQAFESGDYRSVLRCWSTMKKFEKMPCVSRPQVVESMQRFKK